MAASSSALRTARGMTLIELMVAVTIAALLMVTAAALLATIAQVRREGERTLEVAGNANIAIALIQYDAARAGYRFSSPAMSTYVLNNVTGAEAQLSGVTNTSNCGFSNWGVAEGTDVIEFREGNANLEPGQLSSIAGAGPTYNVVFGLGAVSNPFSPTVVNDGAGEVVMFANTETGCAARVGLTGVNSAACSVALLKQDFTDATGSEYYNCPVVGMSVFRLASRIRYLVCMPPSTSPEARPALFRQESGANGIFPLYNDTLHPMVLVQEGIEDLQVAPRIGNPLGEITGAGCSSNDFAPFCYCDELAPCTNYNPTPTLSGGPLDGTLSPLPAISRRSALLLRGMRIAVTAISTRSRVPRTSDPGMESIMRPPLMDHPAPATATDGYCRGCPSKSGNFRTNAYMDVVFNNLAMVVP